VNPKTSEQTAEGGARAGGADGSLGEQLRRAREARGVTLREVSEQTRITIRHLEAIEADNYQDLPGGIFNKSFIKSYARHVGFPEARALELYERAARAGGVQTDEVATTPHRSRVYTGEAQRSPVVTFALSAVMVVALISVVYLALHFWNNKRGQTAGPAATPTPAANANAAAPAATPTPAPPAEFRLQVKATRPFWLTSWQDGEKKRGRFLKPDAPEEFAPEQALNLLFDKASADALQVTVGGQALRPPASDAKEVLWTITKDNYRQFAQ